MVNQTVQSNGIFHGLPTFPNEDSNKYTAIVTGANGISGAHILQTLANAPERWEKIYAFSRKPTAMKVNEKVTFISIDFLDAPEKIAQTLKDNNISA
jgi:nucleoside-diphosphate-sugar epimerase